MSAPINLRTQIDEVKRALMALEVAWYEGLGADDPVIDLGPLAHLTDPRAAGCRGEPVAPVWLAGLPATALVYVTGEGVARSTTILDRCDPTVLRSHSRRERALMRALLQVALATLDEAERTET